MYASRKSTHFCETPWSNGAQIQTSLRFRIERFPFYKGGDCKTQNFHVSCQALPLFEDTLGTSSNPNLELYGYPHAHQRMREVPAWLEPFVSTPSSQSLSDDGTEKTPLFGILILWPIVRSLSLKIHLRSDKTKIQYLYLSFLPSWEGVFISDPLLSKGYLLFTRTR